MIAAALAMLTIMVLCLGIEAFSPIVSVLLLVLASVLIWASNNLEVVKK